MRQNDRTTNASAFFHTFLPVIPTRRPSENCPNIQYPLQYT
ncbi:hypothetical protein [uncultured Neisseria sp.]|nr:hypothetical protein [uncultured Neisseria sp.]